MAKKKDDYQTPAMKPIPAPAPDTKAPAALDLLALEARIERLEARVDAHKHSIYRDYQEIITTPPNKGE